MILQILNVIYVLVVVLFLFNLTIFIHELGHYLVGRRRGAKIDRFAIWFGPALWSKKIDGVEFRLGCIPLGGYVAFPQLAMEEVEGKSEIPAEELPPLKPRDKIPILFAGSIANILLGIVVACVIWVVGIPRESSYADLKIGYVPPQSLEWQAGIRPGDKIVTINGKIVTDWDEVTQHVALSLSEKVQIGNERNGSLQTIEIIPEKDSFLKFRRLRLERTYTPMVDQCQLDSPAEKAGIQAGDHFLELDGKKIFGKEHMIELVEARANKTVPLVVLRNGIQKVFEITPKIEKNSKKARIGILFSMEFDDQNKVTVYPTPWNQIVKSLLLMVDTLNALLHTRTTGVGVKDLSGPLGIGTVLYRSIELDFRLALYFLVLLNINLAVVNLLPIPVLDGGHIVFSLIEQIRKKPLNQKFMEVTQTTFIVMLLGLMLYVTYNDLGRMGLSRFFSGKNQKASDSSIPPFEEMPNL